MSPIEFKRVYKGRSEIIDVLALTSGPWSSEGRVGVSIPHQPSVHVLQYTTAKTQDGTKIYDQDVLRDGADDWLVYWCSVRLSWRAKSLDDSTVRPYLLGQFITSFNVTNIGSIYEHPKLNDA